MAAGGCGHPLFPTTMNSPSTVQNYRYGFANLSLYSRGCVMKFWSICLVFVLAMCLAVSPVWAKDDSEKFRERIAQLEAKVEALEAKLQYLYVEEGVINGLAGPHVIVEGANLHVQNGSGLTDSINGLGNLLVGYNESASADEANRSGSHNLIVGGDHEYIQRGGFVAGRNNNIYGAFSTVSGGDGNTASGDNSSVSGGISNIASGWRSSVSGGNDNTASDYTSSVSGGNNNTASGWFSNVSGGTSNTASGHYASVSGGIANTASGNYASVSGGKENIASSQYASVSGGFANEASGQSSSVSGGYNRSALDLYDWVAGGLWENQ